MHTQNICVVTDEEKPRLLYVHHAPASREYRIQEHCGPVPQGGLPPQEPRWAGAGHSVSKGVVSIVDTRHRSGRNL
jgi:hypothetical protein